MLPTSLLLNKWGSSLDHTIVLYDGNRVASYWLSESWLSLIQYTVHDWNWFINGFVCQGRIYLCSMMFSPSVATLLYQVSQDGKSIAFVLMWHGVEKIMSDWVSIWWISSTWIKWYQINWDMQPLTENGYSIEFNGTYSDIPNANVVWYDSVSQSFVASVEESWSPYSYQHIVNINKTTWATTVIRSYVLGYIRDFLYSNWKLLIIDFNWSYSYNLIGMNYATWENLWSRWYDASWVVWHCLMLDGDSFLHQDILSWSTYTTQHVAYSTWEIITSLLTKWIEQWSAKCTWVNNKFARTWIRDGWCFLDIVDVSSWIEIPYSIDIAPEFLNKTPAALII